MSMKTGYTYILTNYSNSTFYVGVTSNLIGRIWEHKNKTYPGSFSDRYNVDKLVHYEVFEDITYAIEREKEIKRMGRKRKINLITSVNPEFRDLYEEVVKIETEE